MVELEETLVAFEVGGRVEQLGVVRGDRVEAGRVVATLDDALERPVVTLRSAEERVARAQLELLRAGSRTEEVRGTAAELRAAEAQEALVRQDLDRERRLAMRGAVPNARVEDLEASLQRATAQRQAVGQRLVATRRGPRAQEIEAAEARLEAAVAAREAAELRLARYELHAPIRGSVLDTHVEQGETVAPGAPVITVGDPQHPYVDVFVPEGRIAEVRVGTGARVRIDGLSSTLAGRVEHIARETEFTPRFLFSERERPNLVIRVRVRVDDPREQLHAGIPAFVTLEGDAR